MSSKEFWNEEPKLIWTYRKMYMDKLKLQNELGNQQAWLQGIYIFDAVSISIYNAMRKSNMPAKNYMSKPIDFNNTKTEEDYKREEQLRMEEQIKNRNKEIKLMLDKNKK